MRCPYDPVFTVFPQAGEARHQVIKPSAGRLHYFANYLQYTLKKNLFPPLHFPGSPEQPPHNPVK
jgi:hypothetical protein